MHRTRVRVFPRPDPGGTRRLPAQQRQVDMVAKACRSLPAHALRRAAPRFAWTTCWVARAARPPRARSWRAAAQRSRARSSLRGCCWRPSRSTEETAGAVARAPRFIGEAAQARAAMRLLGQHPPRWVGVCRPSPPMRRWQPCLTPRDDKDDEGGVLPDTVECVDCPSMEPPALPPPTAPPATHALPAPEPAGYAARQAVMAGSMGGHIEVTVMRVVGCEMLGAAAGAKSFFLALYPGRQSEAAGEGVGGGRSVPSCARSAAHLAHLLVLKSPFFLPLLCQPPSRARGRSSLPTARRTTRSRCSWRQRQRMRPWWPSCTTGRGGWPAGPSRHGTVRGGGRVRRESVQQWGVRGGGGEHTDAPPTLAILPRAHAGGRAAQAGGDPRPAGRPPWRLFQVPAAVGAARRRRLAHGVAETGGRGWAHRGARRTLGARGHRAGRAAGADGAATHPARHASD